MKRWIATGLTIAAALQLWAQAPEMFRYQGRLVNGTNLVNATVPMSFKLYDALSGGTRLYEDSNSVLVVDGLYSTMIGDNTVFGSLTNAMTNATVYLELTVNGETLSPRERLVSVPYSLNAGGNATPAGMIVLSSTYPNPELTAKGYSIYNEDVTTADWQEISPAYFPWSAVSPPTPTLIGHNNQLWVFANNGDSKASVFTTDDGKKWNSSRLPFDYFPMNFQPVSHNGKIFLFSSYMGFTMYSSSDGQVWNVSSNTIDTSIQLNKFVSFKGSIWGFGSKSTETGMVGVVMSSPNGVTWATPSNYSWYCDSYSSCVLTTADKMWVFASGSGNPGEMVWRSTDGTNWTPAVTNLPFYPSYTTPNSFIFNGTLWCFSSVVSLWNSSNDGNSWDMGSTNLPVTPAIMAVHSGKLWIAGSPSMNSSDKKLYWSTNGTDWAFSLAYTDTGMGSGSKLASTDDGRIWFYTPTGLKLIGGVKKQDGLYYYRKD